MADLGKQWEARFKEDWERAFPNTFIFRLKDQMSGYKEVSANPCDFICFTGQLLFMAECKEHKGASLPFDAIRQYDKLLSYKGLPNVRAGIFLWLSQKNKVYYIPIATIEQLKLNGEKSVGLRHIGKYKMYDIPAEKLRIFMKSDYSVLMNTVDGD